MGYVILLWHSLSLPYNYFEVSCPVVNIVRRLLLVLVPISKVILDQELVQSEPMSYPRNPNVLLFVFLFFLFNVPVNNFSVMLGRIHRFLGI